jgi:hypothetical protein
MTMTAHQYEAALNAYWDIDPALGLGDCDGCRNTHVKVRPICRNDGIVWMICDRCFTHNHLRNCRVCHIGLPVIHAQVVDKTDGWNYCPAHAPQSFTDK